MSDPNLAETKHRMKIKEQTIQERKKINKMIMLESLPNGKN
jgi:hypothetical protein